MSVTISGLQLENVKRVKAFAIEPAATGLTILGGKNAQGKTSVLDAIAWLLGGGRYAPSTPQRDGAMNPPKLSATLSNGLVVQRAGKNSTLTVTDPTGKRHGQALLDSFVSQFALDLPRFLHSGDRDRAEVLLKTLGLDAQLADLNRSITVVEADRRAYHTIKETKVRYAEELPEYPDAPAEPVSISDLIQQQQAILAQNGENQRLREQRDRLAMSLEGCRAEIKRVEETLASLRFQESNIAHDLETATKTAQELTDQSTAELEASIADVESINAQVTANEAKANAADEASQAVATYEAFSIKLEGLRAERMALLAGLGDVFPGLTVEDGALQFNGRGWDCMSGSEQLRVATAIVRKLNPECGFVLLDGLEQFDLDTLTDFGAWLEAEQLQAIATRVSTGEECTIIIEDGLPQGQTFIETTTPLPEQASGQQWGGSW